MKVPEITRMVCQQAGTTSQSFGSLLQKQIPEIQNRQCKSDPCLSGRKPAGIRPESGRKPAGIRPETGRNPAGIRPEPGRNPAGTRPESGRNPTGIRPESSRKPAGIRPESSRKPAGIRPESGKKLIVRISNSNSNGLTKLGV